MNKNFTLILLGLILFPVFCFAQVNPRMVNRKYASTVYVEDFTSSQTFANDWSVSYGTKDNSLYSFIDTCATVDLDEANGTLELSMVKIPGGYTISYWGGTFTTNFIAGEVVSNDYFGYGVYQCNAKFAYDRGSFPAFWLYNDSECSVSKRNEIDIVECKVNHSYPTLDNNMFYYPVGCGSSIGLGFEDHQFSSWDQPHVFECVYAPDRIEFWVDDVLYHTVLNNGDYKYPDQVMRLILSQQVVRYDGGQSQIVAPQTSTFYWVKAKEFFLAPEIAVPNQICTTASATMDVSPLASNVTWQITPSNLVVASSGTGLTANITASPAATGTGTGTITYTFSMPSGETFTASKSFWIGLKASFTGNTTVLEGGTGNWTGTATCGTPPYNYEWFLREDDGSGLPGVLVGSGSTLHLLSVPRSTNSAMVSSESSEPNIILPINNTIYYLYLRASDANNRVYYTQEKKIVAYGEVDLINPIESMVFTESKNEITSQLKISPNPASDEATIEINESGFREPDINTAWQVEVYDAMQSLKVKAPKVKGAKYLLNTRGWKEGVYLVRVKRGNEVFSGKLAVKP